MKLNILFSNKKYNVKNDIYLIDSIVKQKNTEIIRDIMNLHVRSWFSFINLCQKYDKNNCGNISVNDYYICSTKHYLINTKAIREELFANYKNNNNNTVDYIHLATMYLERLINTFTLRCNLFDKPISSFIHNINDVYHFIHKYDIFKDNRFIQRFVVPNYLDTNTCKWIINECDYENNWLGDSEYFSTDVAQAPFKQFKSYSFKTFIDTFLLKNTLELIYKKYQLPKNIKLCIDEKSTMYVIKYDTSLKTRYLNMHYDNAIISFQILLNGDFEGGGTFFDDGLLMNHNPGDLIIHSGFQRHAVLPITKGKRYVLVAFLTANFD